MWRRLLCAGSCISRVCMVRKPTITRGISLALLLSVLSLVCFSYYVSTNFHYSAVRSLPEANVKCHVSRGLVDGRRQTPRDHSTKASLRTETKVLVFVETQYSKRGKLVIALLEANRFRFKIALAGKGLPYLTHADKGKFGVVVFENLNTYLEMDSWNRQLLDKYCRQYKVGMITFVQAHEGSQLEETLSGFPLKVHTNLAMEDYTINPDSDVLRVTRAGETAHGVLPDDNWTVFIHNHSSYLPLAYARPQTELYLGDRPGPDASKPTRHTVVLQDLGTQDGIQRVHFGYGLKFWLHRLLFLDSLSYLSHGKFSISLERYVQIDIDDIFVGRPGIRMKPDDVEVRLELNNQVLK